MYIVCWFGPLKQEKTHRLEGDFFVTPSYETAKEQANLMLQKIKGWYCFIPQVFIYEITIDKMICMYPSTEGGDREKIFDDIACYQQPRDLKLPDNIILGI